MCAFLSLNLWLVFSILFYLFNKIVFMAKGEIGLTPSWNWQALAAEQALASLGPPAARRKI